MQHVACYKKNVACSKKAVAKRVRRCSIRLCSIVCPALYCLFIHTEASVHWFFFEKSQENSCGGFCIQTPAHVFSCEFCAIKNIYFVEKLRMAACEHRIYIFFFALILRQNRYLPLYSGQLLGKQRTMLWYTGQPSKISYLRFGDVFYFLPPKPNTQ